MSQQDIETENSQLYESWLTFWRWVLVAMQVVGGIAGLFELSRVNLGYISGPTQVIGWLLFFAAVVDGVLLAMRRPLGTTIGFVIQGLQILQIGEAGFNCSFVCGLQFLVSIAGAGYGTTVIFSTHFPAVFILSESRRPFDATGINVVPLLWIICLVLLKKSDRDRSERPLPETKIDRVTDDGAWPPAPKP